MEVAITVFLLAMVCAAALIVYGLIRLGRLVMDAINNRFRTPRK